MSGVNGRKAKLNQRHYPQHAGKGKREDETFKMEPMCPHHPEVCNRLLFFCVFFISCFFIRFLLLLLFVIIYYVKQAIQNDNDDKCDKQE